MIGIGALKNNAKAVVGAAVIGGILLSGYVAHRAGVFGQQPKKATAQASQKILIGQRGRQGQIPTPKPAPQQPTTLTLTGLDRRLATLEKKVGGVEQNVTSLSEASQKNSEALVVAAERLNVHEKRLAKHERTLKQYGRRLTRVERTASQALEAIFIASGMDATEAQKKVGRLSHNEKGLRVQAHESAGQLAANIRSAQQSADIASGAADDAIRLAKESGSAAASARSLAEQNNTALQQNEGAVKQANDTAREALRLIRQHGDKKFLGLHKHDGRLADEADRELK